MYESTEHYYKVQVLFLRWLLNTWIAESGPWQSFIDFKLPEDERARYSFLPIYDDFFLSLMSRATELLRDGERQNKTEEVLSVGKGLEIFSLNEKRTHFDGVNYSNNMLYAAGLYYLANYSASAWILSKVYQNADYQGIDEFISSFLKRDLATDNRYSRLLNAYFKTGRQLLLKILTRQIAREKESAFNEDADKYYSFLLAESILQKFAADNIWYDLLQAKDDRDRWRQFVRYNIGKRVPIWSFFPSQKLAIQRGILSGATCSLQMPTSSGKTSICELIIYDEFKSNSDCRILYLAPYRALASELKQTLAINVGRLGISSKTIYGGNLPTVEERSSIGEVNLVIATPEKFMAVEDIFPGISETFTTIICDEGHLLDDESRGLSYELLLSRMKGNAENKKRFIFVSAIIPNISVVNSWLGGSEESLISSEYRPTELEYAFLKPMDKVKGFYLDVNPHKRKPYNYQLYKFLFGDELEIPKGNGKASKITSKKGLSVAAALKATHSGTVALFAPHKRGNTGVEDLAAEAVLQLTNREQSSISGYSPSGHLSDLEEYFTVVFGLDYLLTQCSRLGVLFHHGDFPQSIREIIEDSMRQGKIRLVICTNTLAEGVNLPIKTIVLHSTSRFSPYAVRKHEPIKLRDLKNLVGRAGRAGRETKGMVIIPHESDFWRINELIRETNIEPVRGQLYNIISLITGYLQRKRMPITAETLDSLSEELQELLDSIDVSIIDLLAEETEPDELNQLVSELITQTLSFYQANASEKKTLSTLFQLRTEKLRPIVDKGEFAVLKHSGANIRLYDDIVAHFDFDDNIWSSSFEALEESWLTYILDNGVFQLERYKSNLQEFNTQNKCELAEAEIKRAIRLWMSGNWYATICHELGLEMHQVLRLINIFISFNVQNAVSVVVRLKELKSTGYTMPDQIANWSSFLQHGIDSQLKLDLIEMGLIDRVGVFALANYLDSTAFIRIDYKSLKAHLIQNRDEIVHNIQQGLPRISLYKLRLFISRLGLKTVF